MYAVTEGNTRGWATGGILAPLIIAVALIPTFALIEKRAGAPLVPPAVWTLPGFVPLFFVTMRCVARPWPCWSGCGWLGERGWCRLTCPFAACTGR